MESLAISTLEKVTKTLSSEPKMYLKVIQTQYLALEMELVETVTWFQAI